MRGNSRTHDSLAAHFEIEPFLALAPCAVTSRKVNDGLRAALRLGTRHHVGSSEVADKADKRLSEGDYVDDKAIDLEDFEPAGMTQEEQLYRNRRGGYRTDVRSAWVTLRKRPRASRGISEEGARGRATIGSGPRK